jgi:hypothetical protein
MSRPDRRVTSARRFLAGFALAAGVAGAVLLVREAQDDTSTASPATTTTAPVSSPSSPSGDSTTTTTTIPPAPLVPLPTVDLAAGCRTAYGEGAELVVTATGDLRCLVGGEEQVIVVDDVCVGTYGAGVRAVLVGVASDPTAWRCSSTSKRPVGSPDWEQACRKTFGETAAAILVVDDAGGWRCGSIVNGVWAVDDIALDTACQANFGRNTFGERSGDGRDGNQCYGVV